MPLRPVSVSQLNEYISRVVGTDPILSNVTVRGEVTNVNYNRSGHVYFTLMDPEGNAKIRCFLPRDAAAVLRFQISDGMKLVVRGYVNLYKPYGTISITIRSLEAEGEGDLKIAFEKLKQKLAAEGLFDADRKKPIPFFPRKVGVITSGTGAAVRDIMKNLRMRNQCADIIIFPTAVQGERAAPQISAAIRAANEKFPDIDVLIVGRGGGSAEELWAFNEESVARAIAASEIPVISAVGHEIDFTIADMVSDLRAETPTKGAVLAVPDIEELEEEMERLVRRCRVSAVNTVRFTGMEAENRTRNIQNAFLRRLSQARSDLDMRVSSIRSKDPRNALEGGCAILTDEEGTRIRSAGALTTGMTVKILMRDGSAEAEITGVNEQKQGDAK